MLLNSRAHAGAQASDSVCAALRLGGALHAALCNPKDSDPRPARQAYGAALAVLAALQLRAACASASSIAAEALAEEIESPLGLRQFWPALQSAESRCLFCFQSGCDIKRPAAIMCMSAQMYR